MRAFPVRLPSGVRYWTVLDEELAVVPVADSFLRQVRFGRGVNDQGKCGRTAAIMLSTRIWHYRVPSCAS